VNKLLYLLFLSVFFLDFFHFELGIVPRSATWLPEILAILTCLVIVLRFATLKEKPAIHPKYVTLILLYSTIILIGIILNTTPPGSIIVGIRTYFKHLPFFLLPAVYDFSDEQFKKQLQFILPLLILQCPLAVYQRLFQYRGVLTGDVVTGTLDVSSALSITMICSIAVIFALYLKKKIGFKLFLIIACCLFLPTTLNETKGTLVLLPLALILPAFFLQGEGNSKAKSLLTMALIGILFISAFVPIYDHFMRPRLGYSVLDFFQDKNKVEGYLYRGVREGQTKGIRRGDAIVLAYKDLSRDSLTLVFGLGMGNVMSSYFESSRGKHTDKMQMGAQMLAVTHLFWELGLFGVIVYTTFFFFLLRDTLLLRKFDDIFGSFALGWSAVVAIMFFSLVYKNMIVYNLINFMFWYFSGIVAAKAWRMKGLR
jgi:hypothetical protein